MAMKSVILLITLLVVFVAPQANAIGINIRGTVFCPLNATNLNITTNVTLPPLPPRIPVANGTVQVSLLNIPIGITASTNLLGEFSLNLLQTVITAVGDLLSVLTVNITPPPGACNSTLPVNATLQSVRPLQLVRQTNVSIELNVTGVKVVQLNA